MGNICGGRGTTFLPWSVTRHFTFQRQPPYGAGFTLESASIMLATHVAIEEVGMIIPRSTVFYHTLYACVLVLANNRSSPPRTPMSDSARINRIKLSSHLHRCRPAQKTIHISPYLRPFRRAAPQLLPDEHRADHHIRGGEPLTEQVRSVS